MAVAGIPTHTRSLSPTQAHLTPAAVREALRRYSLDTAGLRIVDAGDAVDPDAVDATAWIAAIDADLLIAIGGDNSATVPGRAGPRSAAASSPSTRTTTCATASRTARRCGS